MGDSDEPPPLPWQSLPRGKQVPEGDWICVKLNVCNNHNFRSRKTHCGRCNGRKPEGSDASAPVPEPPCATQGDELSEAAIADAEKMVKLEADLSESKAVAEVLRAEAVVQAEAFVAAEAAGRVLETKITEQATIMARMRHQHNRDVQLEQKLRQVCGQREAIVRALECRRGGKNGGACCGQDVIGHSPPCLACLQVGYYKSVIEGYERAALLQFNAMLPAPLEEEPP